MNIISVDDTLLSDDVMQQASFISPDFFEDVVEHNFKRFLLSGLTMGALARFVWSNDTNTSLQKGLFMGLATLLSDLALGVGVKMGYIDNKFSGNYPLIAGQVFLESVLYFPLASRGQVFVPNFMGEAYRQSLISSGASQVAQIAFTKLA